LRLGLAALYRGQATKKTSRARRCWLIAMISKTFDFETMQASWNGAVIARSEDIVTVEGNAYFPAILSILPAFNPPVIAVFAAGKAKPITMM